MRKARILAIVAALMVVASASSAAALDAASIRKRLVVAVPAEVNVVGLVGGVRPEVMIRLFDEGSASHIRLAAGLLFGAEYTYVPLALGYRAIYRAGKTIRPTVGVGVEWQSFIISDADAVMRAALYVDYGVRFELPNNHAISVQLGPDLAMWSEPGVGFSARAGWSYTF